MMKNQITSSEIKNAGPQNWADNLPREEGGIGLFITLVPKVF